MQRARIILLACAFLAAPLAAQPEHPNHRRGLDTPTAYQYENLDAVNLFNGNLSVAIPIAEIRVGGALTVPIALRYNSTVWGFEEGLAASEPPNEPTLKAKVDPIQNAGMGWLVSLGKIYPPFTPQYNDGPGVLLVEPDGTRRGFAPQMHPGDPPAEENVSYTVDGSFMRLKKDATAARWYLESPNGLVREFSTVDGNLLRVRDRMGNQLNIAYGTNQWTLTDNALPTARTHTITFLAATVDLPQRVDRITLAGFNGAQTIYQLAYDEVWIERHYNHTNHAAPGGLAAIVNVALLREITLPASAGSFRMEYHQANTLAGDVVNPSGLLRRLDLPTWGHYEWDYAPWGMASSGEPFPQTWHLNADGVHYKHIYSASGALEGTWTYVSGLGNARPGGGFPADTTREKQTRVTDPLGNDTVHYFTSHPDAWLHGLPFTDQISDGNRHLSRQMFQGARSLTNLNNLKRSEWNRFASDTLLAPSNQRLEASRTVFHDDDSRWAGVNYSDYNGLGRYRLTTTSGFFDAGNDHQSYVAYTKDAADAHDTGTYPGGSFNMWPSNKDWVIDTFEESWDQEGGVTAKKTFDVDPNTSLVRRARIHRLNSGAVSTTDVVIVNDYDARGNLAFERFYGGDTQPVNTGSDLETLGLPASPTYHLAHTTLWGTRATSAYVSSDPTVSSFKTLDCGDASDPGIDASTGLPSRCRDTSQIATSYEYDVLGRLVWEKPESGLHDGWTEYVHAPATATTLASVTVKRWPNGGGAPPQIPLAQSAVVYDGFGRVTEEQQTTATGSTSTRQTLYNAMGWRTSVSEQGNTAKKTEFLAYDAFGRPGTVRPPDSSSPSHSHDVTFTYLGTRSVSRSVKVATTQTTETAASTTSLNDRQGRLYQVSEYADYGMPGTPRTTTTTYGYDVGNRLVSVIHKDFPDPTSQTQTRSFSYDQRGFLLSEQHPEKGGTVFYSNYDARGHVGRKQDGPFDIAYAYDAAERLKLVRESGLPFTNCTNNGGHRCLKTFTYGTSNAASQRTNGRLQQASRFNYVGPPTSNTLEVIETYTYAGRQGRVSRKNTAFNFGGSPGAESWKQTYTYDALGNVMDLGYPDCTWTGCPQLERTITYGRSRGWLTSVGTFASPITYHANGLFDKITHGNGVVDEQVNDPQFMPRPRQLKATLNGAALWDSGNYEYDGAGNVKGVGTDYFIYDRVSRVIDGHVKAGPAPLRYQTYSYDPFGNLQSIGGDPGAPGRATPTSTATNRLIGSSYDTAGNLLAWNGQPCATPLPNNTCFEYDAFGMVTRTASGSTGEDWRYIYTADDERFWAARVAPAGGWKSIWTLRDLDGTTLRQYDAHVSWATARDYVYRDGKMLATSHPDEGDRHLTLDHLGTPRLVTATGAMSSVTTGGASNCIPAPADYDGDGSSDYSLLCDGAWHFYSKTGAPIKSIWVGNVANDRPIPADYDGDGDDDVMVWRGGAYLYYDYATGANSAQIWVGDHGNCVPAPGDFNGDGIAELSQQCRGAWYFYAPGSLSGVYSASFVKSVFVGDVAGQIPVPGDYQGIGRDQMVIFRNGAWEFWNWDTGVGQGGFWTISGAYPAPLDIDGDGDVDFTVFNAGAWFFFSGEQFGQTPAVIGSLWTGGDASSRPAAGNFHAGTAQEPAIFHAGAWLVFRLHGMPVTQHAYFAFGEEINPRNQDLERKKFTGHERDLGNPTSAADDLDYMHARFYNPQVGRFLSTDPRMSKLAIMQPQLWNRYSYAVGNPLKWTDPTGEVIDLSYLSEDQRKLLLGQLNAFTGNTYGVDASLQLVLLGVGSNSSATATSFFNDAIASKSVYGVVESPDGINRWNSDTGNVELNFNTFAGAKYGKVDPNTFNLGSTLAHELYHGVSGLFDTKDGTRGGVFSYSYDWTGPVVDFVNTMRAERGLPLRSSYPSEPVGTFSHWDRFRFSHVDPKRPERIFYVDRRAPK
jgi:RHS repeat-associated protein